MRKIFFLNSISLFVAALLFSGNLWSQESAANRPSPAVTAKGKVGNANIVINYSSPSVKGRQIWGGLVPYGQVWRAGANEATTFETDRDIKVEGKTLPAGKYALFAIPNEREWTIIFNKTANQWGAFKYDEKQDALRVTVTPRKSASANEKLKYDVNNQGIVLSWENMEVPVTIQAS